MSDEAFALWIRAEDEAEAAAQGRAWADAEPRLTFIGVLSVVPHAEFWHVWTVTVAARPLGEPLTLGLVS